MHLAIAQIQPTKGFLDANIRQHLVCIQAAAACNANALFFPELSLTGYEPQLASTLAIDSAAGRLDIFQHTSNKFNMTIAVGMPTHSSAGIQISIIIFRPHHPRLVYAKQELHADELPFFVPGTQQLIVELQHKKIAPGICYESLRPSHAEEAKKMGADFYIASVAKSAPGIKKAYAHYPEIAERHAMPVLMANCVGFCDNFLSVGQSAAWNSKGRLMAKLDAEKEGLIIFDTDSQKAHIKAL